MQLRALKYFSQVAKSASFREAADKLFVAPGAVTRQIDILEHYYGAQLIERGPRGIKLTREGELLAQAVDATLRELESVKAQRGFRYGKNMRRREPGGAVYRPCHCSVWSE